MLLNGMFLRGPCCVPCRDVFLLVFITSVCVWLASEREAPAHTWRSRGSATFKLTVYSDLLVPGTRL